MPRVLQNKPLRYLHLWSVLMSSQVFSLLSVVWPRRLLMWLLCYMRVHKPDIFARSALWLFVLWTVSDYFLLPRV